MSRVLIIGAGGVGRVTAHKCAQVPEVFRGICLASRTLEKCREIAGELPRSIETARVDAGNVSEVVELIRGFGADLVIHVALPYQDLSIMDACLETGIHYIDTANYEPPETPCFEYQWQWAYQDRFRERGLTAVLGCGFDPGVTNVFCAYAQRHLFDQITSIDILDCNAGDHGYPFATNFSPEINLREVSARGRFWEDGRWKETGPMAISREFDFPEIGRRKAYLMYHEELESLVRNLPGLKRTRFWMTFSDAYLKYLRVLQNVGLTRIDPIEYEGHRIVPLRFLKTLLPDPASLGSRTHGKTCIGCLIEGVQSQKTRRVFLYNVSDHQACYREVGSQAVSYTAGVPPVIAAELVVKGVWRQAGVVNVEQLDPDPFMALLSNYGLPWHLAES